MSDIYRLDDLDGMTVGAGQNFDNFAEVIDYLLETKTLKRKYQYQCPIKRHS